MSDESAEQWLAHVIKLDEAVASHSWDGDRCTECGYDAIDAMAGVAEHCTARKKAATGSRWHRVVREVRTRDAARRRGLR